MLHPGWTIHGKQICRQDARPKWRQDFSDPAPVTAKTDNPDRLAVQVRGCLLYTSDAADE